MFSSTVNHGPDPGHIREGKYKYPLDADPGYTPEGYVKKAYDFMPPRDSFKTANLSPKKKFFTDRLASMKWWDAGVGALIQKLEDLGLAENTLVIYTADHGQRNHGKTTLYETVANVSLIMKWPAKMPKGRVYKHIMGSVDYTPTILDICGAEVPNEMKMDGVSFGDVLRGTQKPVRDALLLEMGYARAIRTDNYKYIAVRYPEEIEAEIASGKKYKGCKVDKTYDQPYLILHR